MSRRPLIIAAFLMYLSLGPLLSPAQAIPLQHFDGSTPHVELLEWETGRKKVTDAASFSFGSLPAPTNPGLDRYSSSDPCGFSQGWLAQQKNGVVACSTLADFYAPKVTAHPVTRFADIAGGSGLALLLLGLGMLGLATRRPVWITHLMR